MNALMMNKKMRVEAVTQKQGPIRDTTPFWLCPRSKKGRDGHCNPHKYNFNNTFYGTEAKLLGERNHL